LSGQAARVSIENETTRRVLPRDPSSEGIGKQRWFVSQPYIRASRTCIRFYLQFSKAFLGNIRLERCIIKLCRSLESCFISRESLQRSGVSALSRDKNSVIRLKILFAASFLSRPRAMAQTRRREFNRPARRTNSSERCQREARDC